MEQHEEKLDLHGKFRDIDLPKLLAAVYEKQKTENLDVAQEVSTNMVNFNEAVAFDMVSTIIADGQGKQNSPFFHFLFLGPVDIKNVEREHLLWVDPKELLTNVAEVKDYASKVIGHQCTNARELEPQDSDPDYDLRDKGLFHEKQNDKDFREWLNQWPKSKSKIFPKSY